MLPSADGYQFNNSHGARMRHLSEGKTMYLADVIKENQLQQAAEDKAHDIELYSYRREQKILADNPHIGVLNGGNRGNKFYSYQTGHYVESYIIEDLV